MPPDRDLAALRTFHQQRAAGLAAASSIDDDTWRDLDLDRVFASLDRCESPLGQIALYGWLRAPALNEREAGAQASRAAAAEALAAAPAAKKKLQRALEAIPRLPPALAEALWLDRPLPTAGWIPLALTCLAIVSPLAFFLSTRAGWLLVLSAFAINAFVHAQMDARVQSAMASLRFVERLLSAASALSRAAPPGLEAEKARISALLRPLAPLRRAVSELPAPPGFDDFAEYPRTVFLTRERRLTRSAGLIHQGRAALCELIDRLGALDAAQSVRLFRQRQATCAPVFQDGGALELTQLRHPALEKAVPNDLSLVGGVVITGSNMSGKSTFLRALALNALFAQSLGFACARSYRGPFVRIASSLQASDSLAEGRSYYYAEALRIRALLAGLQSTPRALYLLDEPFRGTNSAERIAAAYGVLRYMRRAGALVMAATHDFELPRLLGAEYQCAHFADEVSESGLVFDYRLKSGFAGPRNAVRLLGMLQYPEQVLLDAEAALNQPGPAITA